jgi:hypothetical protein
MPIPLPPPRRSYDGPIEQLPRPRESTRDRHHLFWPGAIMNGLGLNDFRSLACAKAPNLDSMVHTLVHQRFNGVIQFTYAEHLEDFKRRAKAAVERHARRQCGCFNPNRRLIVDVLTLEVFTPRRFQGPPCTAIAVDQGIYKTMRDYYATVAPITERVRDELAARCNDGGCACHVQGIRRPPVWAASAA